MSFDMFKCCTWEFCKSSGFRSECPILGSSHLIQFCVDPGREAGLPLPNLLCLLQLWCLSNFDCLLPECLSTVLPFAWVWRGKLGSGGWKEGHLLQLCMSGILFLELFPFLLLLIRLWLCSSPYLFINSCGECWFIAHYCQLVMLLKA